MEYRLRSLLAHVIFRIWPTDIGLETLMQVLNPPPLPGTTRTIQLKGYSLTFEYRPNSYMGRFLSYRRMYEEGPLRTLRHILRPGDAFLDAGANAGLYTVIAAHLVGPSGVVLACEPQNGVSSLLRANVIANGLANVQIHLVAIGRTPGRAFLYQPAPNNDGEASLALKPGEEATAPPPQPVTVSTVALLLQQASLAGLRCMKIDVEGAELEVLSGTSPFLTPTTIPYILWEGIDRHLVRFDATLEQVWQIFWSNGYQVLCHSRGRWHPIRTRRDHDAARRSGDFLSASASAPLPSWLR